MPQRQSIPHGHGSTTEFFDLERSVEEIAREGARRVLQAALEAEVDEHVRRLAHLRDVEGRQLVVRNGHGPERRIQTAAGSLPVRRPRVDERKAQGMEEHQRFTSAILPRFLRRTPTLEGTIATLYLKGISTNDFPTALEGILGEGAKGLSPSTIVRLKQVWEQEYDQWRSSPLGSSEYAYIWADGVHFNVRLEDERSCMLVVPGSSPRSNTGGGSRGGSPWGTPGGSRQERRRGGILKVVCVQQETHAPRSRPHAVYRYYYPIVQSAHPR